MDGKFAVLRIILKGPVHSLPKDWSLEASIRKAEVDLAVQHRVTCNLPTSDSLLPGHMHRTARYGGLGVICEESYAPARDDDMMMMMIFYGTRLILMCHF